METYWVGKLESAIKCSAECTQFNPNNLDSYYKQKELDFSTKNYLFFFQIGKYQKATSTLCYDIQLHRIHKVLIVQNQRVIKFSLFNYKDNLNIQKPQIILINVQQQIRMILRFINIRVQFNLKNYSLIFQKLSICLKEFILIQEKDQDIKTECFDWLLKERLESNILRTRQFNFSEVNHWSQFSEALLCLHQYNQKNLNKIDGYFSINKEQITIGKALECFNESIQKNSDNFIGYYSKAAFIFIYFQLKEKDRPIIQNMI